MSTGPIRGALVDLDETLYSREDAFWNWIAAEAQSAGAGKQLGRERIAELDQRGRGDKHALLEHLAAAFSWREEEHRSRAVPERWSAYSAETGSLRNFLTCMMHLVLDELRGQVHPQEVMLRIALHLATCWNRESDSKPSYAQFATISQERGM
jgi:hypothetical protein